jgi:hypothetical protein
MCEEGAIYSISSAADYYRLPFMTPRMRLVVLEVLKVIQV